MHHLLLDSCPISINDDFSDPPIAGEESIRDILEEMHKKMLGSRCILKSMAKVQVTSSCSTQWLDVGTIVVPVGRFCANKSRKVVCPRPGELSFEVEFKF